MRLLREGADFDERLGADERTGGAERAGAEALPPERLRLGVDSRLGDEPREKSRLRDGAEARELREGADAPRSRPEFERTVRSRGIATEERELLALELLEREPRS